MLRNILWIIGLGGLVWIGAHAGGMVIAPLTTAFASTGARPSGYSINDWVAIRGPNQPRQLARKLGDALHIHSALVSRRTPEYRQFSQTQSLAGITTRVIVERLGNGTTFAVLDRTSSHGFSDVSASERLFETALKRDGAVHTNVNLEGTLPGRISQSRERQLVRQSLKSAGAVGVNGIKTRGYVAMSGRTPFIEATDSLQGRSVNIQVALTYNNYLHATQVFVGSPLLTVTY